MDGNDSYSFNNTNHTMDSMPTGIRSMLIFQELLFATVCIIGLLGNTLVVYVVIRFSKMQTVTNMYIVNLAIADECFLIGIPFLIVTMVEKSWIFGDFMCKTYLTLTSINQFTSSTFLLVMSADRYIAVCHPISSPKWRTPFISKIVSLVAWTLSIALMIPLIINSKEVSHHAGKSCVVAIGNHTINHPAITFTSYTFVFGFAIPIVFISVFYLLVIRKLQTVGPQNKSKDMKRSHRKVTQLVLTVISVYILCWLPYWVLQLAEVFSTDDTQSPFILMMHLLASCLSYSNSAMNPILYAFLSDNFKKSFLKACTCAAGKDINAALHLENSVFPRKNKQGSMKLKPSRATSICPNNDEECDVGPLDQSRGLVLSTV
ncbi:somatostatin receptor type 2-like isoform X2 [Onthophagus taurus]|uniref:somatostatin receptor type 2-like isoform X2 n=1 Tax=Onthophagus taurus TaxID=166361 RepID=UPI000C2062D8|nr:somatostatin receptor type 2-like isoform X2 [Onthophagus taurus]